ncbi:MAG: hypothetical protein WCK63_14860 [Betaproteobacteria bacterium]
MSNVHQFQAPESQGTGNTSADTTDESKCDIEHGDVLDSGREEAGLILDGQGRARVQSAIGGAKTICNILFQGEIENDLDGGFTIKSGTRLGLLQALSACLELIDDHNQGGGYTKHVSTYVDCDSKAYQHMLEVQKFAGVEKEQRRDELMARMNRGAK